MLLNKKPKLESESKLSIWWLVWFGVCLFPLSIEQNGVGMSANYLFVFTPVAYILMGNKLMKLPKDLHLYLLICSIIFVISITYQISFFEHGIRRIASFMIFISILSLPTINFSEKMINSFYFSVIVISFTISAISIVGAIRFGVLNPSELKGVVGTQRIGFVYIFGFWILISLINLGRISFLWRIFLFTLVIVILFGIVLTFSRAAYLSFVSSVLFYYYLKIKKLKLSINNIMKLLISILLVLLSFILLGSIYPDLYEFIDNRFFLIFQDVHIV